MSMAEVYEVATFYAHFDGIKEGEAKPPALTIRVCDSLSCELAGAQELKTALESGLDAAQVRVLRAPCMGRCDTAPVLELGHNHIDHATVAKVDAAIAADDTHAHLPDYQDYAAYVADGGYAELTALREKYLAGVAPAVTTFIVAGLVDNNWFIEIEGVCSEDDLTALLY